ncbi:queuosine precursor transporter [Tistrella bauzanensis]|uniref:queuosine precursor transporter n=1 Tax=Tistrella TaxID=171436 RepID=UPI0031F6EB3D
MITEQSSRAAPLSRLWLPVLAMTAAIVVSNILVGFPINDWLTWGAFSYPLAFLVTDLTNRRFGTASARRVVYAGFAIAVVMSLWLADPRIAIASGAAFLVSQLMDVAVFDRLRRRPWWQAPLVSSSLASAFDTVLFFTIAFLGTGLPWISWAVGDWAVKMAMALAMLVPYRALMRVLLPVPDVEARRAG